MATNKVYQTPEASIVFTESGGTLFTVKNTGTAAGRVSSQADRGTGAKARVYYWEAQFKAQSNVTLGNEVRIYIGDSMGSTTMDLTADAALTAESQLNNFEYIGRIAASGTAAGVGPFYRSGIIKIYGRYISVAFWNACGQTFTNVNGDTKFTLTPMPDDIQAAA